MQLERNEGARPSKADRFSEYIKDKNIPERVGTFPEKGLVVLRSRIYPSEEMFLWSGIEHPPLFIRRYYDESPNGEFGVIGEFRSTSGMMISIVTHGEEVRSESTIGVRRERFYPQVSITFPDEQGVFKHPSYDLSIHISTNTFGPENFSLNYNIDDPQQLPVIRFPSRSSYLLDALVPPDIPNKVAFLQTLLKQGSRIVSLGGNDYEVSLFKDNSTSLRQIAREKAQGPDGEEVEKIVTLLECIFPLSITREQLEAIIQERLSIALRNPTFIPKDAEEAKDLAEIDEWVRTDWMQVFGIYFNRDRTKLDGQEFLENLRKAKELEE